MVWEINDSNLNGLSDVLKQTLNPDAAQVSHKTSSFVPRKPSNIQKADSTDLIFYYSLIKSLEKKVWCPEISVSSFAFKYGYKSDRGYSFSYEKLILHSAKSSRATFEWLRATERFLLIAIDLYRTRVNGPDSPDCCIHHLQEYGQTTVGNWRCYLKSGIVFIFRS